MTLTNVIIFFVITFLNFNCGLLSRPGNLQLYVARQAFSPLKCVDNDEEHTELIFVVFKFKTQIPSNFIISRVLMQIKLESKYIQNSLFPGRHETYRNETEAPSHFALFNS